MKRTFLIGLLSIVILSCQDDPTECCIETVGSAYYFIKNESASELKVSFVTSSELGLQKVDSTNLIPSNSILKILEDGIIGVNPEPSNSFSTLTFLRISDSSEYIISTIINRNWEVISRDFEPGEYGLTEYQLTISDSQF